MKYEDHSSYPLLLKHLREMDYPLSDTSQEELDKEARLKRELSMEESRHIRERKAVKADQAAKKASDQTSVQPESLYKNSL